MLLPRRPPFLPCLLGLVTLIFLCVEIAQAQRYSSSSSPPRYNYEKLPKTGFTCVGKLPGRYYPDPETDCQMFHVCVKMNHRDVQDFKFLCPNGTVFDAEHQVCIDYYQVVCHEDVGTNPLGHIFEIYKISAGHKNPDLEAGKVSFVNPDSIERNTLGDDFQVEEYNNNRLASSQNSLNFRASSAAPPKRKSNKEKEDIFFSNKGFIPSDPTPSPRRTTTTTTTTTTTEAPSSSTPRRPSLETFESYETESFSGFIPSQNHFGRGQEPAPDFDASIEEFAPRNEDAYRTEPSTTARPLVFQNTFRTTLSHIPSTTKPSAQTFQQQPTRFNDQYFTRIPSTTRRPVSKAAQFFIHTTNADDYFTPEYRQPTVNPFVRQSRPTTTTSTTFRPSIVFSGSRSLNNKKVTSNSNTEYPYYETTTVVPTSTTTSEIPTTTEYATRKQGQTDFDAQQTTTYRNDFTQSARNSNFFNVKKEEFGGKSPVTPSQRHLPPPLSSQYVEEETLRPRNIHGSSNAQNSVTKFSTPIVSTRPRDTFGFSTVPPPTTAEPFSTPSPTASAVTQKETAETIAARLRNRNYFQKITTKNPEKYSIFFGRSTPSVDEKLPSPGPTTVVYYDSSSSSPSRSHRVRSTTASPDLEQVSSASESVFDRRGRLGRLNSVSSTIAPEQPSSSARPLRRGVRRRVRPGRRQGAQKDFDPQLKYTRRRFESGRVREGDEKEVKNDEIFNAEASVFRGDPAINNFFQEQRKGDNSGSEKSNDKSGQQKQRQPVNPSEQFYGRRVRPNGRGGVVHQISQNNDNNLNSSVPANNLNAGEGQRFGPNRPEVRRRVVKRIRPKSTTAEPGTPVENVESGSKKPFVITGSTLRPVTRINVKTRLGGKIATTYRTTEITDASSSTSRPTSTTTTEPELITASDAEIERKRQKHHSTPFTSTTEKSLLKKHGLSNDSHLVITVLSDKPFPQQSPLSIKKPILPNSEKKVGKPSTSVTKKVSINANANDEESNTRSPDYDYAYYNTDDASDYDSETKKLDHKTYGSKPNKQGRK